MKSIDASTLLFQQDGTSTASLSRVSCASWDPVYADCVGLCDEHGRFQYVDCSTSATQEQFYHLLAMSHDHRGKAIVKPLPLPFAQFEFVPQYPGMLLFRSVGGYQVLRARCSTSPVNVDADQVVSCVAVHAAPITKMCVTPDGELLVTADSAGTVCVWNTFTQSRVSITSQSQAMCSFARAHNGSVTALCALVDAFVSGGTDQAVKLWSISSRQCLHTFDVEASSISAITAFRSHGFADRSLISAVDVAATSLAASPDSVSARAAMQLAQDRLSAAEVELLACASVDGAVFFLSLDSLRLEHVLLLNDENADVTSVGVSSDGNLLAVGTLKGDLLVHALRGKSQMQGESGLNVSYSDDDHESSPIKLIVTHSLDESPVVAASFASEGVKADNLLACSYSGRATRMFRPPTLASLPQSSPALHTIEEQPRQQLPQPINKPASESIEHRSVVPSPSKLRPPKLIDMESLLDEENVARTNVPQPIAAPVKLDAMQTLHIKQERLIRRRDTSAAHVAAGIGGMAAELNRTVFSPTKCQAVLQQALSAPQPPSDAALAQPRLNSALLLEQTREQLLSRKFAEEASEPRWAKEIDARSATMKPLINKALNVAPHDRVYHNVVTPVEPPVLPAPKVATKHLDAKWVASLQVKPNIRSIFSADMFQQFDELKMCDPTRDDAIGYSDFASHVLS